MEKELDVRPLPKQYEAYKALEIYDYLFFGGGAGGGKTWFICESRLLKAIAYPGYKSFIAREELSRLMTSTYQTWIKVCSFYGLKQGVDWKFNGQYHYIEFPNGSRIDLLDAKFLPSDPLYERFGSMEFTDGALEECGEIHFKAFDVLKSRVGRHMNKEYNIRPTLLLTGNPKKNWTHTYFYKPWKNGTLPSGYFFIESLYADNFHTAEEYERALDSLIDPVLRQRLKDGNWDYDDDDSAIFENEAVTDLWTNTIEKSENKYMTVDVARKGKDKTVFYFWKGWDLYDVKIFSKQLTNITALKIKEYARAERIPYSHIAVDEDGVGGGVVDHCRGVHGFVNNSTPLPTENPRFKYNEKQNFSNLKTQCAYISSVKVNDHEACISIKNPNTDFKEDLEQELVMYCLKNPDNDMQKLALEPKDEMKAKIGRSPDYGDAFIMRGFFELQRQYRQSSKIIEEFTIRQRIIDSGDFDPFAFLPQV